MCLNSYNKALSGYSGAKKIKSDIFFNKVIRFWIDLYASATKVFKVGNKVLK